MMIIHPVAGDGGCWWLVVATVSGLQTHAGFNSPLSFQIGSNVHNVHTVSLQSPGRRIPPSKVHFMEIWSNQDKERCKVSNVTNPNKILSSFVKPVFDFSQGSF